MASWIYNTNMAFVEFDGIKVTSIRQAELLFSTGDISNEELDQAREVLKPERVPLRKFADIREQNSPSTLVGKLIKKVREKINL